MTDPEPATPYDTDPAALAWARRRASIVIRRLTSIAEQATADGDDLDAQRWLAVANMLRIELIGGRGPQIAVFDQRLPQATRDALNVAAG